jgi:pimeloyl-ACP methyl ester carboxylesterase
VQTHFADLVYLLRHVRAQRLTPFEKVGVIGYSFGSGAAVLLGASHPEVTAMVSLDGSIGFVDRLPVYEAVPGFKPSRLCTPLLHLNVAGSQRNELRAVSTSECGDRYIASFSDGNHLDFSTLGLLAGRFPSLRTAEWAFENSRQPARVFEAAARLILAFFDAHVRGRREAWKPPPSTALYTVTASEGAR